MFFKKRINTVQDVARYRLCIGCGACAPLCPENNVRLENNLDEGVRPTVLDTQKCLSCDACLQVCPSVAIDRTELNQRTGILPELAPFFGPVLEIWEGFATDPDIRFQGSSGGALTAIALYCLEQQGMHGVLHIGQDPANPLLNKTGLSRTRSDLLRKTGSRYAPASACDGLRLIEEAPDPCVFVGQPAEVSALRKAQRMRTNLNAKVGLALSFFCAGSPPARGTLELLKSLGVDPAQVASLRYRGMGWPGYFAVTLKGEDRPAHRMTYQDSWAFVQRFRPYSVYLWPDGTGEDADISCGDPWYRKIHPSDAGSSILVVRTELGRRILAGAREKGYLKLEPAESWKLIASQENLVRKRGAVWGRRLAFRAFGLPVTKLTGFPLFRLWTELPLKDKIRSVFGTARRIIQRKYYRPL